VKWLSKAAVLWALDDAPEVPPHLVSTLIAVARYAGEDGRGAYPSALTVAQHTRKSERQAKRDLAELSRLGLLTPGDNRIVAAIRADQRPNVWDLAMLRGDTHDTPSSANGVSPMTGRGDIQGPHGVSPMSPEEILNRSGKGVRGANRAAAPRHAKPKPTRCAMCRIGDHPHCTGCDCDHTEANGHKAERDWWNTPEGRELADALDDGSQQ
jgi:hypothetical protein